MVSVHQSKLLFHAGLLFLSTFISLLDRVIYSISGSKYFFSYVCHWKWSTRSRGYYIPFRWYVIVRAFSFIQRKWIFREVMWNDNKRAQFFSCFFSSAFLIFSKISLKSALLLSVVVCLLSVAPTSLGAVLAEAFQSFLFLLFKLQFLNGSWVLLSFTWNLMSRNLTRQMSRDLHSLFRNGFMATHELCLTQSSRI